MFGPYTPLQQLDLLADAGTKSYVVGSTNSLLLQQKDRYSDILINVSFILRYVFLFLTVYRSLMKIPSPSHLPLSEVPWLSLPQTDVGLIYLPKSSMKPGMMHIRSGQRRLDIWALRNLSDSSSKNTCLRCSPA